MEPVWGLLLAVSSLSPKARPLALLLAVKWAVSYFAAGLGVWLGAAVIDILLAASVAYLAVRLGGISGVVIGFVHALALVAHGIHWTLWDQGVHVGVQYYAALLWLHTVSYFALCWSGRRDVMGWLDRCRELCLRCLDGFAPAPKQRVGRPRR